MSNTKSSSAGFTLVELLVSATIAIISTVIILQTTIGTGNISARSQAQSDLSASLLITSTAINLAAITANPNDVSIYSDVSYASQVDDASPNLTVGSSGSVVGIKKSAVDDDPAVCYLIGRADSRHSEGISRYFYNPEGNVLSQTVFGRDDATGNCLYDTILGRSVLTRETAKVGEFNLGIICPADDCQDYARLRYNLTFNSLAGVNRTLGGQNRSSVGYVSSISLGLN